MAGLKTVSDNSHALPIMDMSAELVNPTELVNPATRPRSSSKRKKPDLPQLQIPNTNTVVPPQPTNMLSPSENIFNNNIAVGPKVSVQQAGMSGPPPATTPVLPPTAQSNQNHLLRTSSVTSDTGLISPFAVQTPNTFPLLMNHQFAHMVLSPSLPLSPNTNQTGVAYPPNPFAGAIPAQPRNDPPSVPVLPPSSMSNTNPFGSTSTSISTSVHNPMPTTVQPHPIQRVGSTTGSIDEDHSSDSMKLKPNPTVKVLDQRIPSVGNAFPPPYPYDSKISFSRSDSLRFEPGSGHYIPYGPLISPTPSAAYTPHLSRQGSNAGVFFGSSTPVTPGVARVPSFPPPNGHRDVFAAHAAATARSYQPYYTPQQHSFYAPSSMSHRSYYEAVPSSSVSVVNSRLPMSIPQTLGTNVVGNTPMGPVMTGIPGGDGSSTSGGRRSPQMGNDFYEMKMKAKNAVGTMPVCRHWIKGTCWYGATCKFRHPDEE